MRKGIGKTKRFEIFKRDGFRCQYCGKNPEQDVVLEVDHIIPIAKGGGNEIENLITACFDCNRGKRDNMIDTKVVNKDIKNEVEQLKQQSEILKDYYKYLKIKNKLENNKISIKNFIDIVGEEPDKLQHKEIENMIKKFGLEIAIDGWNIFNSKGIDNIYYFIGICNSLYWKNTIPEYEEIVDFYNKNISYYDKSNGFNNKKLLMDIGLRGIEKFMNKYSIKHNDLEGKIKEIIIKDVRKELDFDDYEWGELIVSGLRKHKEILSKIGITFN